MTFKKEIRTLKQIAKKVTNPFNICKTAYSSQGCVKNVVFRLIQPLYSMFCSFYLGLLSSQTILL